MLDVIVLPPLTRSVRWRITGYEGHMQMNHQTSEFAVGWFTLSLINAGLAQSKGRSGAVWWLASLFLGPICTLLIVICGPVKPLT